MSKRIKLTPKLLADCLVWAMEQVPEKIDTAAGIGCKWCDGIVAPEHRKGLTTDPVSHTDDCPWQRATLAIWLYRAEKAARRTKENSEGCQP